MDDSDNADIVRVKTGPSPYSSSRHPLNTSGQTYAKAARSSPAHLNKTDGNLKVSKKSETSPASSAGGVIVNGCLENENAIDSTELEKVANSKDAQKSEAALVPTKVG